MRRREFIALVGGVAITWPHAAFGERKSGSLPRIGILTAYPEGDKAQPLKPQLLAIALALMFADIVAVLLLQSGGLFFGRRAQRAAAVAAFIIAGSLLLAGAAFAQTAAPTPPRSTRVHDGRAIQATAKVTFGCVLSGDAATDEVSRQGPIGLNKLLVARTTVEPGDPYAVNVLTDEIAFFPILYWPVLGNARPLPEATLTKIDAYMKQGGMIIFDTKDYG